MTLIKSDRDGIDRARRLSLFLAFGGNDLGAPVAAGALYRSFGLLLSPSINR